MSAARSRVALAGLQWTLGLVVLAESLRLALASESHFIATHALLHHLRPMLAWSEVVAAILFLIPRSGFLGGCALLVIFGVAAILHLLHGELDIGSLLVYAAAVLVVLANHAKKD